MEVEQARHGQIETYKRRLDTRKSLRKGGHLTTQATLQKIKDKRRTAAEDQLKKAKRAIRIVENKAKKTLKDRGIKARKDEKARLTMIKENALGRELPTSI